jgi:glucosyl-3-phosphoglycerate synthase
LGISSIYYNPSNWSSMQRLRGVAGSAVQQAGEHDGRGCQAEWFRRRTTRWQDWPVQWLLASKERQGVAVSVVIPARNEERTVAGVVAALARSLMSETGLVDEIVVMDSDSTDATPDVAAAAGATVYRTSEVAAAWGAFRGKGEALWKSLWVTRGDLLVFVDADLTHWGPHFVTGLLGPLLADQQVLLAKGFYERLYTAADGSTSADGGRVTELVARPLLSLWWPELAAVVQPLAGEWAARRQLMESLPVPVGYGVELAVLLDTAARHGVDSVAQVDLGRRGHRHQASHDLAVMAAELLVVAERRKPPPGRLIQEGALQQFTRSDHGVQRRSRPIPTHERPPLRSLVDRGVPFKG